MLSNVVKHWERLERCRVFTVASCSFLFGFTYLCAPLVFQCPNGLPGDHINGRWLKLAAGEKAQARVGAMRLWFADFTLQASVSPWKCDVLDNKDIWIYMIYVCTKELKPVSGSRSTTKTSSKTSITTKKNLRPKAFSSHQVTRSYLH